MQKVADVYTSFGECWRVVCTTRPAIGADDGEAGEHALATQRREVLSAVLGCSKLVVNRGQSLFIRLVLSLSLSLSTILCQS